MKLHSFIALLAVAQAASAITLDVDDKDSVRDAVSRVAKKLVALYPQNETSFIPGEFGLIHTADGKNNQGYYWWEGGAVMGVRGRFLSLSRPTPLTEHRHGSITGR